MNDATRRLLEEAVRKQRHYAGFFHWHNKNGKEAGIVREFVEALAREGGPLIMSANQHSAGQDPPDFDATTATGECWGIEITELVDEEAVGRAQRDEHIYTRWSDDGIINHFREVVREKGAATAKGGPYDRYVLLIHTDEDDLPADRLRVVLNNQAIQTRLITMRSTCSSPTIRMSAISR